MLAGVSTASLYPLETEKAVSTLGELGVRNIELFVNDTSELDGDVKEQIKLYTTENKMNIVSVHPFSSPLETHFLFSDYPRRVKTITDIYRQYFVFARDVGAKLFVLHGAYREARCTDETCVERYLMLSDIAADYGITIAQENVHYCRSGSLDFLRYMQRECGGRAKFVLDIKQAVRAGYDPKEVVKALGSDIIHIHVSDNKQGADCLPVGKGTYDIAGLVSELNGVGFDGVLLVELYRRNYGEYTELTDSVNRLENIISLYNQG